MNKSIKYPARLSMLALVVIVTMFVVYAPAVRAVQAYPGFFEDKQPDGTVVRLRLRGDEHFHWMEDENGFTVVRSPQKAYVYGQRDGQGKLAPTALRVGRDDPKQAGLSPRILPSPEVRAQSRLDGHAHTDDAPVPGPPQINDALGTKKNLVVLLRFSDHVGRTLPSQSDINTLFNTVGGHPTLAPTGSVRDYYTETSYGQMTLESTVLNWVTLPQTEAYYANNDSGLTTRTWEALRYALDAVDATVNFDDFDTDNDGVIDAIAFVHSGYAAEFGGTDAYGAHFSDRMWSHKWAIQSPAWTSDEGVIVSNYHINPGVWGTSGSAIGRIGVICHETGHFFGLPDLYDTDNGDPGNGIGSWGIMANSWGFDNSQYYPPQFCSWSKMQLGWLTPIEIDTPGNYALPEYASTPTAYKISTNFPPGEYLLLENRQPIGTEAAMPQGGLCIFHIDENAGYNTQGYPGQAGWPENGNHYRVAVLQADGFYDLETGFNRGDALDVYHENGIDAIGPATLPSTDAYQGGNVYSTGNLLYNIQKTGANMAFTYDNSGANVLAEIELSESSFGFALPVGNNSWVKSLEVANTADAGSQNLDYAIIASADGAGGGQENVGNPASLWPALSNYAAGNVFEVDSNTTLQRIDAALSFTGAAQLIFIVYEMDGVGADVLKTPVFSVGLNYNGGGAGYYAITGLDVPLQANKFYIIAVAWNSPSISPFYEFQSGVHPDTSFGSVERGYLASLPLPNPYTQALNSNPYTFHQRLTTSGTSWLSVQPDGGTLPGGASQFVSVSADASGLSAGNYAGQLSIFSNDADEGTIIVPVGLTVGLQNQVYVDFSFPGVEYGTMANPYSTLREGIDAVLSNGTVTILGGGNSPETFDITKPVNVEASGGEATVGETGALPIVEVQDLSAANAESDAPKLVNFRLSNPRTVLLKEQAQSVEGQDTKSGVGDVQPAAEQNRPTPQRSERGAARGRNR